MNCLACRSGNHGLMQGCVAISNRRVDFDDGVAAIVCIDGPSTFTGAAKIEMLTVGRCAPPVTKPCRYRFGMDGIGQTRSEERRVGKECVSTCRFRGSPFY